MNKKLLIIILILTVLSGVAYLVLQHTPTQAPAGAVHPIAGPGARCGGNMTTAPVCTDGYHCEPEPGSHLPFGDVGGICVHN